MTASRNPLIESLFDGVAVACFDWAFDATLEPPPLEADEATSIDRAVPLRRLEFAVGRACAREALSSLGFPRISIPRLDDRSPGWPDGVTGSISHTRGYAVAVVALAERRRIGIDVESWGRLDDDISDAVSTPDERALVVEAAGLGRDAAATVIFSAKEAFYKAQYAWTASRLGFDDVRVVAAETPTDRRIGLLLQPAGRSQPALSWPIAVEIVTSELGAVAGTAVRRAD